jgi:tetratricopeptide (TPR) repeat protein
MDDEDATSPTDVFSSYVGTIEDILPAFGSRLEGNVLPEWFVTKEIPTLKWLDTACVDRDILRRMNAEIRSMQVVRRLILEGNIAARSATDKKGEEEAAEKWAKAMLRNPRDPMLLERLDRLERNAKGFLEVGKVLQAMKCYETIILVNPKDAVAIHNFGLCLRKIGKSELAEKVLERARELAK